MGEIAGVDGVPDGWVVVRLLDAPETGRPRRTAGCADAAGPAHATDAAGAPARKPLLASRVEWAVVGSAAEVVELTARALAVGVDIPLGLPIGRERRACDELCAELLGRARSSVFPAPPRRVLDAATHAEACVIARELTGRAVSIQTYNIGPKILDWDAVHPLPPNVIEVHPELAFRGMAPGTAFAPKKTARGAGQRIAALASWVELSAALADLPSGARLDDCLDALAATWSAARWAAGTATVLGEETGERGRVLRVAV